MVSNGPPVPMGNFPTAAFQVVRMADGRVNIRAPKGMPKALVLVMLGQAVSIVAATQEKSDILSPSGEQLPKVKP